MVTTNGPSAILIGPPGAGKTTVGAALATRLGAPFIDTDALVEQRSGASIGEIFVEEGEPVFRAREAEAVRDALADEGIVALGGGAPMQPEIADLLEGRPVVFLDVAIADASHRVGFDQSRPLLAVNPRSTWTRLMNQRRPTYERLARWRVDTAGRAVDDIVSEIAALLARE